MAETKLIRDHHSLTRNLKLNDNYLSNDGDDEGIRITDAGLVGIGVADPDTMLEVYNVGTQLKLSGSDTDFAIFYVAADGALNITTNDADAQEGEINLTADGHVSLDSYGSTSIAEASSEPIIMTPGTFVLIDKDLSHTTASADIKGLHIDVDRVGMVLSGTDYVTGIDLDVNHTGATGSTTVGSFGIRADIVGDDGATSYAYGLWLDISGADACHGIYLDNENGGTDFRSVSSADSGDYFTLNTIADGETTLTTVEGGVGSTAHLNMVADGDFTVDAVGEIDFNSATCGFTAQTGTDAVSIDWGEGNKYNLLLNNSSTVTFGTNPMTACNLLLKVLQGNGGSKVITWAVTSGTIYWAGGGVLNTDEPTLTTTDDKTDILSFYFDGTNYFGVASLDFDTT